MVRTKYNVVATKRRTGELIEGVTTWDGLSSLFAVITASGEEKYVSELDDILSMEPIRYQLAPN